MEKEKFNNYPAWNANRLRNYRLKPAAEFLNEGIHGTDAAYKSGFSSPAYINQKRG